MLPEAVSRCPCFFACPLAVALVLPFGRGCLADLRPRHDVVRLRAAYDAENIRTGLLATRATALRIKGAGNSFLKPLPVAANMDMGFEPSSDEDEPLLLTAPLVLLAPPEIPLLSRETFLVESVESYRAYKNACKMLPWAVMYPDEKYKIGLPGASWQELLYDVNLAPVWKALDELNRGNQFWFFPMMDDGSL